MFDNWSGWGTRSENSGSGHVSEVYLWLEGMIIVVALIRITCYHFEHSEYWHWLAVTKDHTSVKCSDPAVPNSLTREPLNLWDPIQLDLW